VYNGRRMLSTSKWLRSHVHGAKMPRVYFTALGGCTGRSNNEIKEWQGVGSTKQRDGWGQTSGSCTASKSMQPEGYRVQGWQRHYTGVETGTRDNGVGS